MTNDEASVQKLISLLGGSWGRIPLEKQFDEAEQALFHCHQKGDESNDSFLARSEILWSRLLARKLSMEDLQAFVVLRGSTLSSDDKKRVILESDRENAGKLTVKRVSEAIRLLGASFFMDMTGQRRSKTKVYDQANLAQEESSEQAEGLVATDEVTEEDFVETLITEGEDDDALLVAEFEAAASDLIQEDSELAQAYTAYTEARRRLSEKFRNRGFFPVKGSKDSAAKGKGSGGRFSGKGHKGPRHRRSLQERILSSTCRICYRKGHWKAECPFRPGGPGNNSSSAPSTTTAPTTTLIAENVQEVDQEVMPMEFLQVPSTEQDLLEQCPVDETRLEQCEIFGVFGLNTDRDQFPSHVNEITNDLYGDSFHGKPRGSISPNQTPTAKERLRNIMLRNEAPMHVSRESMNSPIHHDRSHDSAVDSNRSQFCKSSSMIGSPNPPTKVPVFRFRNPKHYEEAQVCFASYGTAGILDLGASKTVIGSQHVASLIDHLDPQIRNKIRRCPCKITFRFGNQGLLTSSQALVLPIGSLRLKVAVVPGGTPFLLSNTLMRALHANIDCRNQQLYSPKFGKPVSLTLSKRGLFLLDVNEMIAASQVFPTRQVQLTEPEVHETFVSESMEKTEAKPEIAASDQSQPPPNSAHVDQDVSQLQGKPQLSNCEVTEGSCCQAQRLPPIVNPDVVASECKQHVISQPAPPPDANPSECRSGRLVSSHHRGSSQSEGGIWREASHQDLCRSMERSGMGEIHGRPLCRQHQTGTPSIPEVCRTEGDRAREPADAHSCDSTGQPTDESHSHRGTTQGQSPGSKTRHGGSQGQSANISPQCLSSAGHGRRLGARTWCRDVIPSDYDPRSFERSASPATANAEHGECTDTSDSASREPTWPPAPTSGSGCRVPGQRRDRSMNVKEDWDDEIMTTVHHEKRKLHELIDQFEKELQNVSKTTRALGNPCQLLEVFSSAASPLTHQTQQLGHVAYRFGRSEGDLETNLGRAKLFGMIVRHRPKNIWVSPDCGPWSSWSQLNASKSLQAQEEYRKIRCNLLYQIALCIVLFRHQILHQREFHWEQPARSLMLTHPGLAEVHTYTKACQFDMCRAGELKCPLNGMYMKKGMTVLTTNNELYRQLHGLTCNRQHQHQPIEGTTLTKHGPVLRTEYTAIYPRKFARTIAKCLSQTPVRASVRRTEESHVHPEPTFAAHPVLKPRRKLTFVRSELVSPENREGHENKRRRLDGKQTVSPPLEVFQGLMSTLSQSIPRVGKVEITNPNVLHQLQELFPEKVLVRVIACRGTDRTLAPPARMHPQEAPYRKSVMIQRHTDEVKYEKHWEKWTELSKRQLIRPAHQCRINVTMFARDKTTLSSEERATSSGTTAAEPIEQRPIAQNSEDLNSQNATDRDTQNPGHHDAAPGEQSIPETTSSEPNVDSTTETSYNRFKGLPKWEQHQIMTMHKNLGHPSNDRLAKALQVAGFRSDIVQAALELRCPICAACSPPKHQRPGSLKPLLDFNNKIYIDGVKWQNSSGQSFHFYHILDAGSNFHVAMGSPSRETKDLIHLIQQHWISWAGPPDEMQVDSATEMNSHDFSEFNQRFGIKQSTIPPEAHWQQGKIERHGGFLQSMLTKIDLEHPITDYMSLQTALNQSTHAKNSLSVRHGYAPEVIVFGKHSRVVGSVLSDESIPSHELALREEHELEPNEFKQLLQLRESARKAFHAVDNSDALRRAMLRRPCPSRGVYSAGQWIMIWRRENMNKSTWIGPQRTIIQDGNHTVWSTQGGKLFRSAPEHVRLALPEEISTDRCENPEDMTVIMQQIERLSQADNNPTSNNPQQHETPQPIEFPISTEGEDIIPTETPEPPVSRVSSSSESIPQPDQEPENSRQASTEMQPPAETEDDHNDHLLISEDIDWTLNATTTEKDLAWRCEFELPQPNKENLSQEESWLLLATSAKKQRTEVRLSELTPSERAEFDKAKMTEVQNWVQTGTLSKVLRNQIPEDQILRCRWILTWKPIDNVGTQSNESQQTHKAKARLVVLGYLDPKITEIPRDSPTLNRTSRMLLLQLIASCGWSLESFDIKAAFLQGQPQADRVIAIDPVPELRKVMNMKPWEIGKLNKGAYGLIDAPYLWYCALVSELEKLGFQASPMDPCLFVLRMPPGSPEAGSLAGVLGVHVDDGIGGGNAWYQDRIKLLEKKFAFGSHKTNAFTFTGIEITQQGDNSIHMSQSSYIKKINPIKIDCNRKTQLQSPVTEPERLSLRGLIGSLQYAATNTRPDLSSKLSFLQSSINTATIDTLLEGNRLLHEAKQHHDVSIVIKPIPVKDFRFMAFSDASFASNKKPDSHSGVIIVGTHQDINQNKQCPISPISWGCKKIQRVVTSTLAAETTSLATALDQLAWLRIFWSWLLDPSTEWRKPEQTLRKLQPAITAPTFKQSADIAITDCKSLFDLTTRTAPPQCSEFRVQLVSRAIKEALNENIILRWVHSGAQLADCLTKAMESHFMRATLRTGSYRLVDEEATLKERAKTKDRVRWLKEQSETS